MKQHSIFTWNCQIVEETLFLSRVGSCPTSALTKPFFAKTAVESTHLQHKFISNKLNQLDLKNNSPHPPFWNKKLNMPLHNKKHNCTCVFFNAAVFRFISFSHPGLEMIQQEGQQIVFQFACRARFLSASPTRITPAKKGIKMWPKSGETQNLKDLFNDFFFGRKTHWTLLWRSLEFRCL